MRILVFVQCYIDNDEAYGPTQGAHVIHGRDVYVHVYHSNSHSSYSSRLRPLGMLATEIDSTAFLCAEDSVLFPLILKRFGSFNFRALDVNLENLEVASDAISLSSADSSKILMRRSESCTSFNNSSMRAFGYLIENMRRIFWPRYRD
jgi:hypothetical protein